MMTDRLQKRISKTGLGAVSASLTLAVVLVFGVVTAPSTQAQTFTDLYNFTGGHDGGSPSAGLVRDAKGNLYGTTYWNGSYGWGTVFKVDTNGTETVLYSFCPGGIPCTDGVNPTGGLIRDANGVLYGTTQSGGGADWGTVFKVDTHGTETVLYNFAGGASDGCLPDQTLVRDKAGNFYGTAGCGSAGKGVVFELSPQGKETVLHNFAGGASDGAAPVFGSLLIDKAGNLYGDTEFGGTSGQGVVYKLGKGGFKVLHSFAGGTTDGCFPFGSVAMDKNGNLYSTTYQCGVSGKGVVWKLSKKGKETVLHSFAGAPNDGDTPEAGVRMDAKGNLYGNTTVGGATNYGAVYRLDSKRKLTLLHSFAGSDGQVPLGDLILDGKGKLYGTAEAGGTGSSGTVWSLKP
jgi:uncharacterized repeat protein (TIGR03803 family)